jgi:hypothetical protein
VPAHGRSMTTTASTTAVWQLWSTPPGWPTWNPNVVRMSLNGPFANGVTGLMETPGGRSHPIRAVDVEPGRSFRLETFWTTDAVVHPSLGSIAEFGFPGAPARLKMQVDRLEPGRLVSWVCQGDFPYWTATRITWELRASPNAGETTLLFTHTGWAEDYPRDEFAHVNYVWGQIVARLNGYAETGQPQPFFAPAAASHA